MEEVCSFYKDLNEYRCTNPVYEEIINTLGAVKLLSDADLQYTEKQIIWTNFLFKENYK